MIASVLSWLSARLMALLAMLLAAGLLWQSIRIDGWPFLGGGLKAQVADLSHQVSAQKLADANALAAALAARQARAEAAEGVAADATRADQATQVQVQTILRKVPVYVSETSNRNCVVPVGAVRLLDAAASGADPGDLAAAIAPGQPDDAASGLTLSDAVALLAADLGIARQNAGQLSALQQAVGD
jgi:hypothetical protein